MVTLLYTETLGQLGYTTLMTLNKASLLPVPQNLLYGIDLRKYI